jgi:galactokinase
MLDFDQNSLKALAISGEFFSYVAGTVSALLESLFINEENKNLMRKNGILINNHTITLPMKKGLSSSAAVCVLVAKCFDVLYDLNLSNKELMDIAYQGEMLTPSRCGRMDQCVVMGGGNIGMMEFDNGESNLKLLKCSSPLYFVLADLNAAKNTKKILQDLNDCFPFPSNEQQAKMIEYTVQNETRLLDAAAAVESGDVITL